MADKEYRLGIPGERINDALIKAEKIVSYKPDLVYAAGDVCVHKGEVWTNTSGDSTQGVEPGTNYNIWNVGYSNPNLLDNPWFTINQRGITLWTNGLYGVDRWKLFEGKAEYSNGLVKFSRGDYSYGLLAQPIEASMLEKLHGSTLTFSVKFSDYTIICGTVNYFDITTHNSFVENPNGISLDFDPAINGFRLYIRGDETVLIQSVKLELNSVSTLALDTEPNYAAELLKCQRYYQRYKTIGPYGRFGSAGVIRSASEIDISIPFDFKTEMRINPTISTNGKFDITNGYDSTYTVTSISVDQYTNFGCGLKVKPSASLSQLYDKYFLLRASNDESAYIEFSADV